MFFHLVKKYCVGVSWVSFQSLKMLSYSILEFSGLIVNVTYFNTCLLMSTMSPIALFPVMDFACVPLPSFGFSFLVVIEIGSLPDRYTLLDPTFPYWNSSTFSSATKKNLDLPPWTDCREYQLWIVHFLTLPMYTMDASLASTLHRTLLICSLSGPSPCPSPLGGIVYYVAI